MPRLRSQRLFWALILSLLVHFLLVSGVDFSLPDWTDANEPIEVMLTPLPTPPTKTAPLPKPQVQAKRPAPKAKPEAVSQPARPQKQAESPAARSPAPQPVVLPEAAKPDPIPAPKPVQEEPAPSVTEEEQDAVPPAPKRVEINYRIFRGKNNTTGASMQTMLEGANVQNSDRASVGEVQQTFQLEADNRYTLQSVAKATGLISLFYSGKYEEQSEGLVTDRGLKPQNYRLKRGSGKTQSASFNWAAHTVALDAGANHATVEVADGTQDMLSFMYQFMFVPPLEQMLISVANGKKLKIYTYLFMGEDQVDTRIGKLRAWHIAKSGADSDDKMELWLAADYRYLPVRIRQTDRDGTETELLATSLTME